MLKSNGTQEEFTNNINIADKITIKAIIMGEAATITIHNPAIMAILKATTVTEIIITGETATITIHNPAIMAILKATTVTETIITG